MPTDEYGFTSRRRQVPYPFKALSVPLHFVREGFAMTNSPMKKKLNGMKWNGKKIKPPNQVTSGALNKWLFNKDTVDKVLEHLWTHGQRAEDSDRLGKTIIFAKNHDHAVFIEDRFNANYPHLNGHSARLSIITHPMHKA